VRFADEKTTDRVGTVIEVLPRTDRSGDFDRYRVEFADNKIEVLSDLQLAPGGPTAAVEGAA
jgi:hypothetical protein